MIDRDGRDTPMTRRSLHDDDFAVIFLSVVSRKIETTAA